MGSLGNPNATVRRPLPVFLLAAVLTVHGRNGSWSDGFRSYGSCDGRPLVRKIGCGFLGSVPRGVKMEVRKV